MTTLIRIWDTAGETLQSLSTYIYSQLAKLYTQYRLLTLLCISVYKPLLTCDCNIYSLETACHECSRRYVLCSASLSNKLSKQKMLSQELIWSTSLPLIADDIMPCTHCQHTCSDCNNVHTHANTLRSKHSLTTFLNCALNADTHT